ncbi:GNAT family N-acetyltransferase [Polycladomyces subterraneus]|uniref:GNAT family N-acetyltransferase n=1 Tax=Polycladomyces subterraneus TaxID=1016997 RepID=A0ABT8IMI8_9BACL|nr:GNAT family N-acyltransferase [Polycladomyces subterraneus]MDN4594006.1 GNAT family N-acetyltransferase [Polycladomyces subterraneus]
MAKTLETLTQLTVKLAENEEERQQVYRLRYRVFVEEKNNRLLANPQKEEYDSYDTYCDHLIVVDHAVGEVIGTYRLLPGDRVQRHCGFYSESLFDLSAFRTWSSMTLELGRSCVAPEYRDGKTIQYLWAGIADYLQQHRFRYLIGCASLPLSELEELNCIYSLMHRNGVLTDQFGIRPIPSRKVEGLKLVDIEGREKDIMSKLPPLLKGYCRLGAKLAIEPAYDPVFSNFVWLVVLETSQVIRRYRRRFLDGR